MGRCLLSCSGCFLPVAKFPDDFRSRRRTTAAESFIGSAGATGWSVMEHVVFSAAVDGAGEEFRRVSSLEEAVRVVEHLRNDLGIEDASVFSLTAVPLAFRTYYRVEVPGVPLPALEPTEAPAPPLLAVPSLAS